MDSFTIELVSNASGKLVPNNTLSSFTNFLPEQVNWSGNGRLQFQKYPTHQCTKKTEGKFKFFDKKLSKSTSTYNLEPGLYTSITDTVEAMNTLIQERNNHNETCITVKVSRRTQKGVTVLANDTSGLAFCSTDLGHIFRKKCGKRIWGTDDRKKSSWTRNCLRHCSYPFVYDLQQQSSRVQHCSRHKSSLATMLSLYLKAKRRRHYNNWRVHELWDIQ